MQENLTYRAKTVSMVHPILVSVCSFKDLFSWSAQGPAGVEAVQTANSFVYLQDISYLTAV